MSKRKIEEQKINGKDELPPHNGLTSNNSIVSINEASLKKRVIHGTVAKNTIWLIEFVDELVIKGNSPTVATDTKVVREKPKPTAYDFMILFSNGRKQFLVVKPTTVQ